MTLSTAHEKGPFGNDLSEWIWMRRTTIAAVARAVGMERPELSQVVNGHRLPSAVQLDALCTFFATESTALFPRDEFRAAIEATRAEVTS